MLAYSRLERTVYQQHHQLASSITKKVVVLILNFIVLKLGRSLSTRLSTHLSIHKCLSTYLLATLELILSQYLLFNTCLRNDTITYGIILYHDYCRSIAVPCTMVPLLLQSSYHPTFVFLFCMIVYLSIIYFLLTLIGKIHSKWYKDMSSNTSASISVSFSIESEGAAWYFSRSLCTSFRHWNMISNFDSLRQSYYWYLLSF